MRLFALFRLGLASLFHDLGWRIEVVGAGATRRYPFVEMLNHHADVFYIGVDLELALAAEGALHAGVLVAVGKRVFICQSEHHGRPLLGCDVLVLHASERFEAEPAGLACGVDGTPVHVDAVVVHAAKNLIGQLEAVFDVGGVYEFDTLHRFAAAVRLEIDMAVRRFEQKRTLTVVGARDFDVAVDAGKNGAAFAAAVIGKPLAVLDKGRFKKLRFIYLIRDFQYGRGSAHERISGGIQVARIQV